MDSQSLSGHISDNGSYSSVCFTGRRPCLVSLRRRLEAKRSSREARLGLVFLRGLGGAAACLTSSLRRSRASCRFCSWDRYCWASMTRIPSLVIRLPASFERRRRTVSGSDGEPATSKRSWTAVDTLLTCCPPGPDDRLARIWISLSSISIVSVIHIIASSVWLVFRGVTKGAVSIFDVLTLSLKKAQSSAKPETIGRHNSVLSVAYLRPIVLATPSDTVRAR